MKTQNYGCQFESPIKSKISMRISQSFFEIDSDIHKRSLTTAMQDFDSFAMSIKSLFVKVNIVIGLNLLRPGEKGIMSINLQVDEKTTITDLIKMSVNIFNENFISENSDYRIKPNYRMYKMKPSKKTGKPNTDLPSFDDTVFVSNCLSTQYTLVDTKDPLSKDYLIIVRSKVKRSKFECWNCSIL